MRCVNLQGTKKAVELLYNSKRGVLYLVVEK